MRKNLRPRKVPQALFLEGPMKFRNIISLLLLLALLLTGCGEALPVTTEPPQSPAEAAMEDMAQVLMGKFSSLQVGFIGGEWPVIGLIRSGAEIPQSYLDEYYGNLEAYVQSCGGVLHPRKYTEYSRVILALTALGKDPADVAGYDLLAPLGELEQTVFQGINGAVFALIALDSGNYEVPRCRTQDTQATRELYIQHILEREEEKGGWSLLGGGQEPDLTAMVLQALAPYRDREDVKAACDRAVAVLSALQTETGGYRYGESESCESVAQVIIALTALGIDPQGDPRFVKNGHSLVDRLLDFYTPGQGFSHLPGEAPDGMASEQSLLALAAFDRFRKGETPLYRMR